LKYPPPTTAICSVSVSYSTASSQLKSAGAEVQDEIIDELDFAIEEIFEFTNASLEHHSDRMEIAKQWAQYPNVLVGHRPARQADRQDFPAAISASDRFDHLASRSCLRTMLRTVGGILTKLQTNWAKVIDPMRISSGASSVTY
jgi:hypothetical protein